MLAFLCYANIFGWRSLLPFLLNFTHPRKEVVKHVLFLATQLKTSHDGLLILCDLMNSSYDPLEVKALLYTIRDILKASLRKLCVDFVPLRLAAALELLEELRELFHKVELCDLPLGSEQSTVLGSFGF